MGKHKKFLKSEKAKIKLKGVKLPKGLNVTKTEFQTRKIIIKDQIAEASLDEEGRKKFDLKETLERLKGHNSSYRNEALKRIKENFSVTIASKNLGDVIQSISALCLDIQRDIRRESFKVLTKIFCNISQTLMSPFFDMIISYLSCAMSHINSFIQEDSLLMLDVLLTHVPSLVAANSNRIFPNFLNMISKLRSHSVTSRTLTMSANNKITSVKWRKKVLERIKGMLITIVQTKLKTNNNITIDSLKKGYPVLGKSKTVTLNFTDETTYIPLLYRNYNELFNISVILNKSIGSTMNARENEKNQFINYSEQLLPLLFESWLEARPYKNWQEKSIDTEVVLSNEAALTLKIIMEILECLWQIAELTQNELGITDLTKWFQTLCSNDFVLHVLPGFPYQQTEGLNVKVAKNKAKNQPTQKEVSDAGGQYCFAQNFNIIVFYGYLQPKNDSKKFETADKFLEFITNCVTNLGDHIRYDIPAAEIIKPLRSVLCNSGSALIQYKKKDTENLLQVVMKKYQFGVIPQETKTKFLLLLCDILLDDRLYKAYDPNIFNKWIPSITNILCGKSVSQSVIKMLSKLGRQKNASFLNALKNSSLEIIENLENVHVSGISDRFEGVILVMNLFYWINNWTENEIEILIQNAEKSIKNENIINYIKYIITKS